MVGSSADMVVIGANGSWAERLLGTAQEHVRDSHGVTIPRAFAVDRVSMNPIEVRRKLRLGPATELVCIQGHFGDPETWGILAERLGSTPFALYSPFGDAAIARALQSAGLDKHVSPFTVHFDKPRPTGSSGPNAVRQFHKTVREALPPWSVRCIDHYLGKPGIRWMARARVHPHYRDILRTDNIAAVEFAVPENGPVGLRGPYYERSGALHDMVGTHLLLALSLVIAPFSASTLDELNDEYNGTNAGRLRLKALQSLSVVHTVLGQYAGYTKEPGVSPNSQTPTSAAVMLQSNLPGWEGKPLIINSGKALAQKSGHCIYHLSNGDRYIWDFQNPEPPSTTTYGWTANGYEPFIHEGLCLQEPNRWSPREDEDVACAGLVVQMEQMAGDKLYVYEQGGWGPEAAHEVARAARLSGFTRVVQES